MYLDTRTLDDLPFSVRPRALAGRRSGAVETPPPQRHARNKLPPEAGRRLQALRVLLGDRTPAALAERMNIRGLGAETIRDIESPARPRRLWDYEAIAIADAVGIHPTFFTAPMERLGDVRGE